jgi:hypothetical protein
MIDRLYDNGMLMSGEAKHCNCWEYPTMPRLGHDASDITNSVDSDINQSLPYRKHGYVAILMNALRSRK